MMLFLPGEKLMQMAFLGTDSLPTRSHYMTSDLLFRCFSLAPSTIARAFYADHSTLASTQNVSSFFERVESALITVGRTTSIFSAMLLPLNERLLC